MCSLAFEFSFDSFNQCDPKHSPLLPAATVSCIFEKNSHKAFIIIGSEVLILGVVRIFSLSLQSF